MVCVSCHSDRSNEVAEWSESLFFEIPSTRYRSVGMTGMFVPSDTERFKNLDWVVCRSIRFFDTPLLVYACICAVRVFNGNRHLISIDFKFRPRASV